MLSLIGFAVLATTQNPHPADVRIPEGWKVGYWTKSRYGRGSLTSPDKLEIGFPDYTPTGQVAAVQYEMYRKTLFVSAVVERTRINVSYSPDGMLAVSYPDGSTAAAKARPFDYWSQPKGARHTALALMIPLTRLDFHKADLDDLAATKYMHQPSRANPFAHMQASSDLGFVERTGTRLRHGSVTVELMKSASPKWKWSEVTPLLGGVLRIAEDSDRKIWATLTRPGKTAVVVMASANEPHAIILATMAALTVYVP